MKYFSLLCLATMLTAQTWAQDWVTLRQQTFPTPVQPSNVEWQRDIWRNVELDDRHNAGLFCPATKQQGLFTRMFQLAVDKNVPVYQYCIDGDETFDEENKADIRDILLNFRIFFQEEDDTLYVASDDIPAERIKAYYIREKVYYDAGNSTYNTRVTALCPVLEEDEGLEDGQMRYPMFWMKYEDITPYIRDLNITPNYGNMAAQVSIEDYFLRHMYKGEIYKVSNAFGHTLGQQCASDSALIQRQQQIEKELTGVRHTTYNTFYTPKTGKKDTEKTKKPIKWVQWLKRQVGREKKTNDISHN